MAIPDYETLMLPVLRLTAEGIARIPDVVPRLASEFGLSDEELSEVLPSGRTTVIASRAHWARTYMSKAGLVLPIKRGVFEVTEEGLALLATNPSGIDNKTLSKYPQFADWKARSAQKKPGKSNGADDLPTADSSPTTPLDRISSALEEIEANLADDLLARLLDGSPTFFERAVIELLVAMGYGKGREGAGRRLGRSGDGGIDGVINEDALGLDAVYVQAKRYAPENTIGRPVVQQFVGSLTGEGASKGVLVTTSSFSAEALRYVERTPQRIVLIDGERLARLMIAYGVGARAVQTITLAEIDENFFTED